MADVQFMLDARESARRAGDRGVYLALTSDLARIGFHDPAPGAYAVERVETSSGMETTAIRAPERAIPQTAAGEEPRRAPRALPRCEHNKIVGRCSKCPKP